MAVPFRPSDHDALLEAGFMDIFPRLVSAWRDEGSSATTIKQGEKLAGVLRKRGEKLGASRWLLVKALVYSCVGSAVGDSDFQSGSGPVGMHGAGEVAAVSNLQHALLDTLLGEVEAAEQVVCGSKVASKEDLELENPHPTLPGAPSPRFDDIEKSIGITVLEGGMQVRSTEGGKQHCLLNVGFTSGKASWELRIDEDVYGDECICVGCAVKPVTSSSYESKGMWMYRAYSGELYTRGASAGSFDKFHPNDVVRLDLDMDEGTIAFAVNGKEQGVAFREVSGEVFPCVTTYQHSRAVTLISFKGTSSSYNSTGPNAMLRLPLRDLCGTWAPESEVRGAESSAIAVDKELLLLKQAGVEVNLLQRVFTQCDRDRDGIVTEADLTAHGAYSAAAAQAFIREHDRTGDGTVDFYEVANHLLEWQPPNEPLDLPKNVEDHWLRVVSERRQAGSGARGGAAAVCAAMMLLLYRCSGSRGARAALASPNVALGLRQVLQKVPSAAARTLSLRLMRHLIPEMTDFNWEVDPNPNSNPNSNSNLNSHSNSNSNPNTNPNPNLDGRRSRGSF